MSRALTARQDQVCGNNETYTTDMGVQFVVYPCTNTEGQTLRGDFYVDNLADCIEQCLYTQPVWGEIGPCVAVAFRPSDSKCWLKNSNISSTSDLFESSIFVSALGDMTQFQRPDSQCQYPNNSRQSVENGMVFEITCGVDLPIADIQPSAPINGSIYHHATSLEDCITFCSNMSPKCHGVCYDPTMKFGYHNCYVKGEGVSPPTGHWRPDPLVHTALATFTQPNTSCSNDADHVAARNRTFHTTCDQDLAGADITKLYAESFGACMDDCAEYEAGEGSVGECQAVLYQPDGADGYENCYLKAFATENGTRTGWRAAVVVEAAEAASNPDEPESGSNAWIAGAVVGPFVAVAGVAFGCWWCVRRRRKLRSGGVAWQSGNAAGGETGWAGFGIGSASRTSTTAEMRGEAPRAAELDGDLTERRELDPASLMDRRNNFHDGSHELSSQSSGASAIRG